jgi:hypothetical protein
MTADGMEGKQQTNINLEIGEYPRKIRGFRTGS